MFRIEVPAAFCSWIAVVESEAGLRAREEEPMMVGVVREVEALTVPETSRV
jgi:hypothetical protein